MVDANESTSPRPSQEDPANAGRPAVSSRFIRLVTSSRCQPLLLAGALAAAAVLTRLALHLSLPLPFCLLRHLTGIPCPGCGSTRSLLSWSRLDPLEALRFNPLFFALTVAVVVWAVAAVLDGAVGTRCLDRLNAVQKRWASTRLLIFVLGANWLYLWLTLPK